MSDWLTHDASGDCNANTRTLVTLLEGAIRNRGKSALGNDRLIFGRRSLQKLVTVGLQHRHLVLAIDDFGGSRGRA